MDLLASLLFGAAAINAIEGKGILDHKLLTKGMYLLRHHCSLLPDGYLWRTDLYGCY